MPQNNNNNNNNLYVRKQIILVVIVQIGTIPKSFGKYSSNGAGKHEIEEI